MEMHIKNDVKLYKDNVNQAHNNVFQSSMSDLRVAKDLLAHHLPPEVKEKIKIEQSSEEFQRIIEAEAYDYILSMIKYILEKAEIHDRERFLQWVTQYLPRKLENQAMTLAEQFRNEGRQEGLQKGMQQGTLEGEKILLKRLLAQRFGPISASHLEKIENADANNLLQWGDRILEAETLEEVFGEYH